MCNCDCQLAAASEVNQESFFGYCHNSDNMQVQVSEDVSRSAEDRLRITVKDTHSCDQSSSSSSSSRLISSSSSSSDEFPSSSKFYNQRLRVSNRGLLRVAVLLLAVLCTVQLLAGEMQRSGVEAAAILRKRSPKHAWVRPCGEGTYDADQEARGGKSPKENKITHVKAVLFQTDSMLNKITQEQKESHWVDGDWDHILANFEFPDISKKKFSFKKVHLALQQYLAIFEKFSTIQNSRRTELKNTFKSIQDETRTLLCLVESVINGTIEDRHLKLKRQGLEPATQKRPGFRYYTEHVMERKLKKLTDMLHEENALPIAKVVFKRYKQFIKKMSNKTKLRGDRIRGNGIAGDKSKQVRRSHKKTPKVPTGSESMTKRPSNHHQMKTQNKNKNNQMRKNLNKLKSHNLVRTLAHNEKKKSRQDVRSRNQEAANTANH